MTPSPSTTLPPISRIAAVDAVRGLAVLGILMMNIVGMGLPGAAYDDPTAYGGAAGADQIAWIVSFALADGKMRGLFTMLFGASMAIVADQAAARGANPVMVHYRRMVWLLVIGLIYAWLIWYGDILVEYSLTGAILFVAWRWPPSALFYAAILLLGVDLMLHVNAWVGLAELRHAAVIPGASHTTVSLWNTLAFPDQAAIAADLAGYRGSLGAVARIRLTDALELQAHLPGFLFDSIGMAALGLALYRTGYFTHWPNRRHAWLIALGYGVALPLSVATAAWLAAGGFDPVSASLASVVGLVLRPSVMLAHASLVILLVAKARAPWLTRRLAAAGRMALSNYLATSIVMTSLFYGYGGGLFGRLSRAELYLPVALMWLAMLAWSAPWLARFHYGPVEWLWRSLARWRLQPMRGAAR